MLGENAKRLNQREKYKLLDVWESFDLRQEKPNSKFFKEHLKTALKNIFRNYKSSILTISCIFIILFMQALFILVYENLSSKIGSYTQLQKASVYIDPNIDDQENDQIVKKIKETRGVLNVDFWSAKKALTTFKENIVSRELEQLSKMNNPLPASYEVELNANELDVQSLKAIENLPGVIEVYFEDDFMRELKKMLNYSKNVGLILIAFILLITIGVILMLIKLALLNRIEEVQILRLIGAPDSYISSPFLIEGLIIGFLASTFCIITIHTICALAIPHLQESQIGQIIFSSTSSLSFLASSIVLIAGCLVGILGSYFAVKSSLPN